MDTEERWVSVEEVSVPLDSRTGDLSLIFLHTGDGTGGRARYWLFPKQTKDPSENDFNVDFVDDPNPGPFPDGAGFDADSNFLLDWIWSDINTDGAVLSITQCPFEIKLAPAFFRGANNPNLVFLSGDLQNPDRIPLTFGNNGFEAFALPITFSCPEVALDIKPQSCPNPINVKSRGVLPVAVLGTAGLDVTSIDISSLTLAGVAPIANSAALEDVATPSELGIGGEDCAFPCTTEGADGFEDLTLKFDMQEIVAAIESALELTDGDCIGLLLEGALLDGTPIAGEDAVKILVKGKK